MMSLVAPILYFVAVFGFFEAVLFRNKIDYWTRPGLISIYFLSATALGLALFSSYPAELVLDAHPVEVGGVLALGVLLAYLAHVGRFQFHYVAAKSCDILFQDALALIVFFELVTVFGASDATLAFALYFVLVHLALFFVLPVRFGIVFVLGSLIAGVVFAYLAQYGLALTIFVLHWLFYASLYPTIRHLLEKHYQR